MNQPRRRRLRGRGRRAGVTSWGLSDEGNWGMWALLVRSRAGRRVLAREVWVD